MTVDRREFLEKLLLGTGLLWLSPANLLAQDPCAVQHPLMPPNPALKGQCHNCGMTRPMWARTWFTYENAAGAHEVCSLHCLAEVTLMSGEDPKRVMVALYQDPDKMIPVEAAYFVIGSKAKGTMTMTSKPAFASRADAAAFAAQCGGTVAQFPEALAVAQKSVAAENQKIAQNRKRKGKIVEPVADQDRCPVCGMYPARYPQHKSQLQTRDKTIYHFCSTQCLFTFLKQPKDHVEASVMPFLIWVVDFEGGQWIYAKSAYYVVGSKQYGPMGKEAIPFRSRSSAESFAAQHGGKVLPYGQVNHDAIIA
ncbi:MAG: nitrous oxide reductase accessory protein NosL [Desulfosarcinaceae bacterium]|nr:nitrous oxide reductase accessory protein NosL [Desulfosarcinaceae bacterium]